MSGSALDLKVVQYAARANSRSLILGQPPPTLEEAYRAGFTEAVSEAVTLARDAQLKEFPAKAAGASLIASLLSWMITQKEA